MVMNFWDVLQQKHKSNQTGLKVTTAMQQAMEMASVLKHPLVQQMADAGADAMDNIADAEYEKHKEAINCYILPAACFAILNSYSMAHNLHDPGHKAQDLLRGVALSLTQVADILDESGIPEHVKQQFEEMTNAGRD